MPAMRLVQRVVDFFLTVLLWAYFLFGYLFVLLVFFVPSYIRLKKSDAVLQRMNYLHLRAFFAWLGFLAPGVRFIIPDNVRGLRSSIIVCNHISYLDPILLVSLFPRQTTIVKDTFFSVPIFGWFLKKAGYVPSSPSEMYGPGMITHLEDIKRHLEAGGNLFVFPEGTRSREERLLPFNKGVFSIARYCNTGLKLVYIRNTDKLFRPGSFAFQMGGEKTISLELIATLTPVSGMGDLSAGALAEEARRIFERKGASRGPDN